MSYTNPNTRGESSKKIKPIGYDTDDYEFVEKRESIPLDVFPEWLEDFIKDAAKALNCQQDFIAVPMLSVFGGAIGSLYQIQLKEGHCEAARIFTAIVGHPGCRKSPALKLATQPIHNIQKEYWQLFEKELQENKEKEEKSKEPELRQMVTTDITIEAVADVLKRNPKGLILIQDELLGWLNGMNQYKGGKGADLQHWLSLWSGVPLTINRKKEKLPVLIDNPFICITGGLHPDTLEQFGDGKDNGFMDRVLYSYPKRIELQYSTLAISKSSLELYQTLIKGLFNLDSNMIGIKTLTLTEEAESIWTQFNYNLDDEVNSGLPYYLRGPWEKLRAYAGRFSLILELLYQVEKNENRDEVGLEAVEGAIELTNYFKMQTIRVYNKLLFSSDSHQKMAKAEESIRSNGGSITVRDFYNRRTAGCKTPEQAMNLLHEMKEHGLGDFSVIIPKNGGRKSTIFILKSYSI